jgi:hypothetical protein
LALAAGTVLVMADEHEHDWWDPGDKYPRLRKPTETGPLLSCRRCGVNKGEVSETRPCPGDVQVVLRADTADPPLVTKTGKVLTDEDIEALADEAEQGYDVSHLLEKKDRREHPRS